MTSVLCLTCGCITNPGPRCPEHTTARNYQPRRSRADRGYGHQHVRARQALADKLKRWGRLPCAHCAVEIHDGERWDLGHIEDGNPSAGYYSTPLHPRCNQAQRGRNQRRRAQP